MKADKRQAVLEATRRLGFQPNVVARSLARGRSMTIGVLTQLIGSPFYDSVSQGVIAGLSGTGYSPVFVDGQWQMTEEVDAIRALVGRRVDGLVLIGGDVPADEIAELCQDMPTVVVARQLARQQYHCISMDNVAGGYAATRYLIEHGHKQIAMIRGLAHHSDAIDRRQGYERALREAGITPDPALMVDGDFSAESGVSAVDRLLAEGRSFTAIFASNDQMAFGARLALFRRGLKVPEDVSLIGFDDQLESAYMLPPLTTVRQPAREMGAQASQAVLALIAGRQPAPSLMQGQLQIRESVSRR